MNGNTLVLLLVIIFAAVVITGFLFYRQSARARILGPGGVGVEFEGRGRNPAAAGPQPPAAPAPGSVTMEDIDSGGNVRAAAKTGGDVGMKRVSAAGDVTGTTEPPPAPKAPPPPPGAAQP